MGSLAIIFAVVALGTPQQRWERAYAAIPPGGKAWLKRTRACESGGNYRTDTGNGFYGAYQFMRSTWRMAGGRGYPHQAVPREQDVRAYRWMLKAGKSQWPVCGFR